MVRAQGTCLQKDDLPDALKKSTIATNTIQRLSFPGISLVFLEEKGIIEGLKKNGQTIKTCVYKGNGIGLNLGNPARPLHRKKNKCDEYAAFTINHLLFTFKYPKI